MSCSSVESSRRFVEGPLLETTVIGSYPQPDWLVDKVLLRSERVARVRRSDLWKIAAGELPDAICDAARLAIHDMERAGIHVITDGEAGRESYSNHFLCALEGVSAEAGATILDRLGRAVAVPRVIGPIRRTEAVEIEAARFLRKNTDRRIKVTLPGPFTLAQQCSDEHYRDPEALAFAFAEAINEEALALAAEGVDVIQIDEPWFRNDPAGARRFGVRVVDRAFKGVESIRALHMCFGYGFRVRGAKSKTYEFLAELNESCVDQVSIEAAQPDLELSTLDALSSKRIMLGVLDLSTEVVEPVDVVAARIRSGLRYIAADRLIPAPDCGMKYLSRETAFGKLKALEDAAQVVRNELGA